MPGSNQMKQQIKVRASSGIRVMGKSKCSQGRRPGPKGSPRLQGSSDYSLMEVVGASSESLASRGCGLQLASLMDI